jgi:hypothetical protein
LIREEFLHRSDTIEFVENFARIRYGQIAESSTVSRVTRERKIELAKLDKTCSLANFEFELAYFLKKLPKTRGLNLKLIASDFINLVYQVTCLFIAIYIQFLQCVANDRRASLVKGIVV